MTALRAFAALACVAAAAGFGAFVGGALAAAVRKERQNGGGGWPFDNRVEYVGWVAVAGLSGAAVVAGMLVLAFLLATGRM